MPRATTYLPKGQWDRGRPAVSVARGDVFGSSRPFTAVPVAESSTMSPGRAAIGLAKGSAPSGQFPRVLYPRSTDSWAKGSAGQNTTKFDLETEELLT